MTRIVKLRTVTTLDMEIMVGDEYPTGPLSPQDRKKLRDQIKRDSEGKAKDQPGVTVVDVSIKRAFVQNG